MKKETPQYKIEKNTEGVLKHERSIISTIETMERSCFKT